MDSGSTVDIQEEVWKKKESRGGRNVGSCIAPSVIWVLRASSAPVQTAPHLSPGLSIRATLSAHLRSRSGVRRGSLKSPVPLGLHSPSACHLLVLVWGLRRKHGGKAEVGRVQMAGKVLRGTTKKGRICWNRWQVKVNSSVTCFFLLLPGMFCVSQGLTQPSGLCHSGHYCTGGAVSPTPIQHKVDNTGPQQSRVYGVGTTKRPGSPFFPV